MVQLQFPSYPALQSRFVLVPANQQYGLSISSDSLNEFPPDSTIVALHRTKLSNLEFTEILQRLKDCDSIQIEILDEEKKEDGWWNVFSPRTAPAETPSRPQLFVQTPLGTYSPTGPFTNATSVMLRESPTVSIDYSDDANFQWYKVTDDQRIIKLEGATSPTLVPSATEIGYSLRISYHQSYYDSPIIQADVNLLNGSRRLLNVPVRGFRYANRNIRLQLHPRGGGLSISQDVAGCCEPLHPHPLPVTASYAPSPKLLRLMVRNVPPECALFALLEEENTTLTLQAPNRITRESFLLALGLSNHDDGGGDTVQPTTMLFPPVDETPGAPTTIPDSTSSNNDAPPPPTNTKKDESSPTEQQQRLQDKISRQSKAIAELQRQLTQSDATVRTTEAQRQQDHDALQARLEDSEAQRQQAVAGSERLRDAYETLQSTSQAQKSDWEGRLETLETEQFALTNERDVLRAGIEARDNKIANLKGLQPALDEALRKLECLEQTQQLLQETQRRLEISKSQNQSLQQQLDEQVDDLDQSQGRIRELQNQVDSEATRNQSHSTILGQEQIKVQQLKAERNSYKQKFDSLSKDFNKILKHRSLREVERILADDAARREEIQVLRQQKRAAVAESQQFRQLYEDARNLDIPDNTRIVMERNAELERLVSELTEYVNAKEMQVETLKEVNQTLQTEIRDLAQANLKDNEI